MLIGTRWACFDRLGEAFGLNSAEYTHSCANLAHDEVGALVGFRGGPLKTHREAIAVGWTIVDGFFGTRKGWYQK